MVAKFVQQKSVNAKYYARYIQSFPLNLPIGKIDLFKWVIEMTDADYASYSPAHTAMGSYIRDNVFFMTNVENIGIDTLVQHYELKYHVANHVQFYSPKSKAYIMRWFPATVGVPWELYAEPVSATNSQLICMIGVDYPDPVLKAAAWFSGLGGLFLRRHLNTEGKAFALDIEKKFKPSCHKMSPTNSMVH